MEQASHRLVSSHQYAEGQEVLWNLGCLLLKVSSIFCHSSQNGDWLVLPTVCKLSRGGLLGQLFRRIGIGVRHKGSGPGGGQLPLGPLHYLILSPKPQEAIGAVKSQSPAWGADTSSNLAGSVIISLWYVNLLFLKGSYVCIYLFH